MISDAVEKSVHTDYAQPPPYEQLQFNPSTGKSAVQFPVYEQPVVYTYGALHGYPANTVTRPGQVQPTNRPSDYMVLSIVSFFFCFPMAICALIFSNNSKTAADNGNFARALSEGRKARNVGIAAIVTSIVIVLMCVGIPSFLRSIWIWMQGSTLL